jgi:hypothetical protein
MVIRILSSHHLSAASPGGDASPYNSPPLRRFDRQ